jgi:hypothetical protein
MQPVSLHTFAGLQPNASELQELATLLDDRDAAVKQGMRIDGQRYEVGRTSLQASANSVRQHAMSTRLTQQAVNAGLVLTLGGLLPC